MANIGVGKPKYKLDYNKIEKEAEVKPRAKAIWEYPMDAAHTATKAVVRTGKAVGRGVGKAYNRLKAPKPKPPKSPTEGIVNRPMPGVDGKPSSTNNEIEKILKEK